MRGFNYERICSIYTTNNIYILKQRLTTCNLTMLQSTSWTPPSHKTPQVNEYPHRDSCYCNGLSRLCSNFKTSTRIGNWLMLKSLLDKTNLWACGAQETQQNVLLLQQKSLKLSFFSFQLKAVKRVTMAQKGVLFSHI